MVAKTAREAKWQNRPELINDDSFQNVTDWLIEYNFRRPHETLGYATPINFHNSMQVLPACPSRTKPCQKAENLL